MDIRGLGKYAKLLNAKSALEDELASVEAKIKAMTEDVLEYFQRHGLEQHAAEGRILYIRRELWASRNPEVAHEVACAALRKAGLDEYAAPRVNSTSLSAWAREREKDGESLEQIRARFDGAINITETFKVGSRKR